MENAIRFFCANIVDGKIFGNIFHYNIGEDVVWLKKRV